MISMHINLEETAPLSHKIHLLGQGILISLQYTIASKMWYIYIFLLYICDFWLWLFCNNNPWKSARNIILYLSPVFRQKISVYDLDPLPYRKKICI